MKSNAEVMSIIDYIEDRSIQINNNWFYHGIDYDKDKIQDILLNGIKCRHDLGIQCKKNNHGTNGKYYISVSKNLGKYTDKKLSAYHGYSTFMFILDGSLPVYKAKMDKGISSILGTLFVNTSIPYRTSGFIDEYQALRKIDYTYIKGLEFYIKGMVEECINKERSCYFGNSSNDLINQLKDLVVLLDELKLDLPIYDFSSSKEINKGKVLKCLSVKSNE